MEDMNIRRYAKLMQELGLTGLEISENGSRMRLERSEHRALEQPAPQTPAPALEANKEPDNCFSITSPMVGVFYNAPAEDALPFVKIGDTVHKGDVLCIIEAMKLMNEITAECEGTISEICAGNNQVVDYGHVLFRLKRE